MPLLKQAHDVSADGEKMTALPLHTRQHVQQQETTTAAATAEVGRHTYNTQGAPRRGTSCDTQPRARPVPKQRFASRTALKTPRCGPPTTLAQAPRKAPRPSPLPRRPARAHRGPLPPLAGRRGLGALTGYNAESGCRSTADKRRTHVEVNSAARPGRGDVFRTLCPRGPPFVTP